MKIIYKQVFLISIFLAAFFFKSKAQDSCITKNIFKTDSLGDIKEKIFFPLVFKITKDSIIAFAKEVPEKAMMEFKIIRKECNCLSSTLPGYTNYFLLLDADGKQEKATLKIPCKYLYLSEKMELWYDNHPEPRVFTIAAGL